MRGFRNEIIPRIVGAVSAELHHAALVSLACPPSTARVAEESSTDGAREIIKSNTFTFSEGNNCAGGEVLYNMDRIIRFLSLSPPRTMPLFRLRAVSV